MSSKPKILVVDDVAANREMYREWLAEVGHVEILDASSGRAAMELARQHDFAMFLLDINMPDMDGFELASMLRGEPRAEATPIIFVTAQVRDRTYLMRGYRMGAVDFLVNEPVDSEIVVSKARIFLKLFSRRQAVQDMLEQVRAENAELHSRLEDFVAQQEKLREQATTDALTKLPNRTLFRDRLDRAIKRAHRARQHFALAYLDLDGFKAINDTHGHGTGDGLIAGVGDRLHKTVRATDTVARLGGDEFAIIFEGLDSPAPAVYLAEKIHQALCEPMELFSDSQREKITVKIGASIGISIFPDHATTDQELIMLADSTMYAVKRAGGGARIHSAQTDGIAPLTLVRDAGDRRSTGR